MRKLPYILCFALFVLALSLGGCGKSSPYSGLEPSLLREIKDPPLDHVWRNAAAAWYKYHEVYVSEVNTEGLLDMDWWEIIGRQDQAADDAGQLGFYTQTVFKDAFREAPGERFRVVNEAGSHTLVVRISVLEAVPDENGFHELSYDKNDLSHKFKKGSIGIMAELVDGGSGDVIARIEDSLISRRMPVRFRNDAWYSYAKGSIVEWAERVVRIAHVEQYQVIPPNGTTL